MSRDPIRMVDVASKPITHRTAEAVGELVLSPATIEVIRNGTVKKGDVFAVSEIAAIQAAKRTSEIIPLCHQIPLSSVQVSFEIGERSISAKCTVVANYTTGVEMEALVGVSTALLSIWDMVKYLEKDSQGQYPHARIDGVRVIKKVKM